MATAPNYEGAKRSGSVILTSALGTSVSPAVLTGVAAATRVKEVRVFTGGVAPGSSKTLLVMLDDGTNQTIIDTIDVNNTAYAQTLARVYDNVFLVGTGCSIKFAVSAALAASSQLHCEVFGADF